MQTILRTVGVLILGLGVGAALGLYLGWEVWPTEFSDANPAVLQRPFQETYIQMVADVYAEDQDVATARVQLGELGIGWETIVLNTVNNQLLQQGDQTTVRRIAILANDLGITSPAIESLVTTGAAP